MTKNEIAAVLEEIARLLELKGENPFKVRAYQTGARLIEAMEEGALAQLVAEGKLESVKGIGEALARKITDLHVGGRLKFYDELKASVAPGLLEMLQIPSLGPKKIKALHDKLGIGSIAELTAACGDGRVAALDGFGEKTQEKILSGIRNREAYGRRHLWADAWAVAEPRAAALRALPDVIQAEAAGSLRRGLETVGDLDFIVAAKKVGPVVEWFVTRPDVKEVTAQGETKASVRLQSGLQADLRIVPEDQFAYALHHFTGSKDHNVQMRQRALARGLSLSEWGLAPAEGDETVKDKIKQGRAGAVPPPRGGDIVPALPFVRSEKELFAQLGLHFIPPELREGMGEIEAAEAGELPRLVEFGDLRGVFHNHTTYSDGHNTLAEMAAAAEALGWEYLGLADHSKASFQARGMSEEQLAKQMEEIRALNASRRFKIRVLTGVECDILPDGRLDYDDGVLAALDCVVVSVHSSMAQDETAMTARIVRAIESPHADILGHLTGRLLLRREGYRVNVEKIVDAAIRCGVAIELNAQPSRLDMDWRHWHKAAERGLLCAVNPDAHDIEDLACARTGVNAARKGWLQKENVLNTRSLKEIQAWLAKRNKR